MKVFYSDYVLVPFTATWSMVQICIMLYPGRLKLSDFLVQVLCNLNIGSVCVCSFSVLMDTLNMMISSSRLHKKKSLVDICSKIESYDYLWTFASVILTGAFKFCLCFAVILHPRNNLHQWYLVPYSKGDIVLLQSLLSWIFFFTKASSLVSCYIHILLHCSYFAEWFFFYSGSITFCDSHPLGVWVLIHLLQTFPSFTGV